MTATKYTYFNWSSGKDSALALHLLQQEKNVKIDRLLTTVNTHFKRVSMHGLREELLRRQAKCMGLPLDIVYLPENPSMEDYNKLMGDKLDVLKQAGYSHTVYGDIFLEDLRQYRKDALRPTGIVPLFPLWGIDTGELMDQFFELGFRAIIICINGSKLGKEFLGRELTAELMAELPPDVDPCGENGEFHTFCFDGPIFKAPVQFKTGEHTFRHYNDPSGKGNEIEFGFCDLLTN